MSFVRFWLAVCLLLTGMASKAQLSDRSISLTRHIGSATFSYRIDSAGKGILCGFRWKDSLIGLIHLARSVPAVSFTFNGGVCRLLLELPDSGSEIARLVTKIRASGASLRDTAWNYDGLVAAWLPPGRGASPVDSIVYLLTPILSVVTTPIGPAKNSARVSIYSGSVLVFTTTLTQAAPFLTYESDIVFGEIRIEQGMQLTLRIPGRLQQGSIQMKATYCSLDVPLTTIDALVATWDP